MFAPKVAKPQTKAAESPTSKLAPQRSTLAARPLGGGAAEQARMLQGTIGNQATLRYLTHRLSNLPAKGPAEWREQQAAPENMTAREAPRGVSWDFSKIPIFPPDRASRLEARSSLSAPRLPGIIQPKLPIGDVSDPLEHEADRVADQVMRMPDPDLSITGAPPQISRKCAACEEEEKTLRMERVGGTLALGGEAPTIVHEVLHAPGTRLDASARAFFEPRFRRDFADVRIHDDARAARSAREVGALAYTVGQHVVVDPARYRAETAEGRRLLAHELAHTVQQSAPGSSTPSRLVRTAHSLTETLDPASLSDDELTTEIREIRTWLDGQSASSEQGDMLAHAVARLGAELVKRHPPTPAPLGAPRAPESVSVADVLRASSAAGGMLAVGGLLPQTMPVPAPPPPVFMPPPTIVPPTIVPPTVVPPTVVPPTVVPPPTVAPGPAPAAGAGIGAAAAGILVFILIMLWPNTSIMSGREEQRLLDEDEARRRQAAGQSPQQGPVPAPGSATQPGPRRWPNQTCDNETLDTLQSEMHKICDNIPGESCSPSKVSQKRLDRRPCSEIRERIQAFRDCLAARQKVQDECFGGQPDPRHLTPLTDVTNGLNACLALESVNCAPGHPMADL
jgi:hypothetical protein